MVRESEISVAIMYPGSRVDRMEIPLQTTDMDVATDPENAYERDIILLDNADKKIVIPYLKSRNKNCKVIYRIRGDMLRAYLELQPTKFKYLIAKNIIGRVDGAISIEEYLAQKFQNVTGISPIGYAGLSKQPKNWPKVEHKDNFLKAITLTNAYYYGKIQPIIDYAPHIDKYFQENNGFWKIYGRGKYESILRDNLFHYENIEFCGYTENPDIRLKESNIMLHFSRFDSLPNVILEAMASKIPVITNPYDVFTLYDGPITPVPTNEIKSTLELYENPEYRQFLGEDSLFYVKKYHSPEYVGKQYVKFFKELLK